MLRPWDGSILCSKKNMQQRSLLRISAASAAEAHVFRSKTTAIFDKLWEVCSVAKLQSVANSSSVLCNIYQDINTKPAAQSI